MEQVEIIRCSCLFLNLPWMFVWVVNQMKSISKEGKKKAQHKKGLLNSQERFAKCW